MNDRRLSVDETDDVLAGRQPAGRADLAGLVEVTATLHASREVEPPPPMTPALQAQVGRGVPRRAARPGRHRPSHLAASGRRSRARSTSASSASPRPPSRAGAYRRPVLSLAAAAAVLVGVVLVASRHGLPGDVNSSAAGPRPPGSAQLDRPDRTTTTTAAPTTTAPTTTTAPSTTAAPTTAPAPAPADTDHPGRGIGRDWIEWFRDGGAFARPEWFPSSDGHWSGGWEPRSTEPDGRDGDADGTGGASGWGGSTDWSATYANGADTTSEPSTSTSSSSSTADTGR